MSETMKNLRNEVVRLEFSLQCLKIQIDAVCCEMVLKEAEIEKLSGQVEKLQEKCDYLAEEQ